MTVTGTKTSTSKGFAYKTALAVITSTLVLSGCQTTDPYTGEQKTNNASKGAGIGALTGAILGAASSSKGDRDKGILTGAILGGAVGGGIGYYMDQQEAELRRQLQGTGVRVERHGDQIQLVLPSNITFATGSADVSGSFESVLKSVAIVLAKYDKTNLNVDGHTDSVGSNSFNQSLSLNRANAVATRLARQGVDYGRISINGYGESRPIMDNDSAQGRAANRRVELWIQPQ